MASALDKLKEVTVVVADTGDFNQLKKYKPQDSTTNPSLVFQAAKDPQYKGLVDQAVDSAQKKWDQAHPGEKDGDKRRNEIVELALDKLFVSFGVEILKNVPGRVSTEVDARLSYDTEATIKKARELIALYEEEKIKKDQVLIKIASTWEGIKAAEQLEKEGIHCNLTLLFSLVQAIACAEAGVTLISPFVGRITDFFKAKGDVFTPENDPGVKSVHKIYQYYKTHGYQTIVMGASFRNRDQILELAGCDYLTISPALLEELVNSPADLVVRKLDPSHFKHVEKPAHKITASQFAWELCADEMAHTKTAQGIRNFAKDLESLIEVVKKVLDEKK